MLAEERRTRVFAEVQRQRAVRVADLAALLEVSEMTIRRDLDALAAEGALEKVHGGATVTRSRSADEPGFVTKSMQSHREKVAIAHAAAALVGPGAAIGLGAGTTTWELAHALQDIGGLTVVTNSMRIAHVLNAAGRPDRTVVLTGGVRTPSDALVGPIAVSALAQLHLDVVFLGVHGMHQDTGFTTPNLLEAETNRAMIASANRLVVLADHTKWATVGLSTFAQVDQADVLICDDGLPEPARSELAERVGELVLVETPAEAR